ncbi:MAG: hypothetical protein WCC74_01170 [Minisyncoccia bacterium]
MKKEFKIKPILITGIFFFFFIFVQFSFATDKYWLGSGLLNIGSNWSPLGTPNIFDVVFFNGDSVSNATIDDDFGANQLNVFSTYSGSIYLNYGKTLNLGYPPAVPETPIVVSSVGSQVSTTTYPLSGIFLGGSFTFNKSASSTIVSRIVITQKGSLNADTNLANLQLYYKKEETCSTSFPSGATLFNPGGSSFFSNVISITGTMNVSSFEFPNKVCIYIKYDITGYDPLIMGQTVDLEILNPSNDVTVNSSTVSPATAIDIFGATTLISSTTPMLSLEMSNPAKNPTTFYLQDGILWIKEGVNGTPGRITSNKVEVTSLRFTTLTGFLNTLFGSLKIEMTVKARNEGETQEYKVERTFTTTVKVRKR